MKKIILTVVLFIIIGANNLFAYSVEEFGDDVGYTIFKTAWPTATYKDTEVINYKRTDDGYDVVIKFNGKSNLSFFGKGLIWFKLLINTNDEFKIQNMDIIDYHSILAQPFQTTGAISQAMNNANSI